MRIIAGSARRLPLKTVEGRDTRPTSDRIKETLFNILSPSLPGCRFLDLFAGSGQMGLEAASRGAKDVVLVENSRKAAACIEGNISFTKLGDSCTLLVMDAALAVRRMEGQEPFDVIFMDPPYHKGLEQGILEALSVSSLVGEDTEIVAEWIRIFPTQKGWDTRLQGKKFIKPINMFFCIWNGNAAGGTDEKSNLSGEF